MPSESPLEKVTPAPPEEPPGPPTAMSVVSAEWNLAWEEFGRRHSRLKHGSAAIAFVVFTVLGQSVLSIVQLLSPVLPWFAWPIMFLATTVLAQMFVINFAGAAYERTKERISAEHESEKETIRAELKKIELRYEEVTKHKIKFKIDEVVSRVFVQVPLDGLIKIVAKIRLQFENEDVHDWTMKRLNLTLHSLEPEPKEIYTFVISDEYLHSSNSQSIPREQFEGMLIQSGRVTPFYMCIITLQTATKGLNRPEDLKRHYILRLSMDASNQEAFSTNIYVDWAEAAQPNGAGLLSIGAPAFRLHENRRLGN
jgi:hypothetical protein